MFSIATLRKLAFEVFEQSDAVNDSARGMAAPKSRGRRPRNAGSKWLATLVERFNKVDRVHCELDGWKDYQAKDFAAIIFTVGVDDSNPSGNMKSSTIQTFVVTLDCRLVFHERSQRRKRIGRYFTSRWVDGPAREGLWLMECPVVGDEPKLAVPVTELGQIERLIDVIKERQDRSKLRRSRKLKISKLKQHAIVSKLSELAKVHQFSFRIGYGVRDVTLSICLDKDPMNERASFYHFAFPHGKFDDMLQRVPAVIDSLQKLSVCGMSFQTNNKRSIELQGEWVETQRLKEMNQLEKEQG